MRSRAVAVITVSLLVIAAATAYQLRAGIIHLVGADRPAPGLEPFAIGHAWDCPPGWTVKAYAGEGLYYPAYHPAQRPFEVKPARCFRTEAEARLAGFRLAPPPKGGAVFEGVYLVPSSARVRAECRNAAARVGFAIPCPSLLPLASADDPCSLNTGCVTAAGQVWESFGLTISLITPPDFTGAVVNRRGFSAVDGAAGQLLLSVVGLPLQSAAGQALNLCPRGKLGPIVMGTPSLWTDCAGDSSARLSWASGGAIYAVTTQQQSPASQRFVEFFASRLQKVEVAAA
jgi:hypothetical protein